MSDGEWFYTISGERQGPIEFAVLRTLVGKGRLGEEDLVWREGMADWMPVAKVDGLRAGGDGGTAGVAVTPADGGAAVKAPPAPGMAEDGAAEVFDYDSLEDAPKRYEGIGRMGFIVLPLIIFGLGSYFVSAMMDVGMMWQLAAAAATVVVFLGGVLPALSRLKNLGMSRWNFLWVLVPVMNVWVKYRMFACPTGYQDHKEMDKAGKILAGVFVLLVVLYAGGVAYFGADVYADGVERVKREIQ